MGGKSAYFEMKEGRSRNEYHLSKFGGGGGGGIFISLSTYGG